MPTSLTVFYDGGCPLCSREIAHYRRLEQDRRIRWIDITRDTEEVRRHGIEPQAAMASFHVLGQDGTLWTGASAFVNLWQELPRYRWLARFCETLHLLPVMEWGYRRFARWHFAKRCREGACGA